MNTFFFDDVQYPEGLFGGKDFFNPIIYSTEEREVGVWIDNKPLYQKTFDCGALLNAQTKEISFTEDMETATIIDAFAMSTSEGYVISLPDVVPNYVAGSVRTYVSKTAKKIYIYSQADMRTYDKSYVTIQYTKTTDTAGSGSYTTLGVPAHHYDGNEKIIGTWFGETLYERTLNFTQDNRLYYIPNTTYVKKLVKHNGECTKDNFDYQIPYFDGADYLSVGNDSNGVRIYSSNYFVGAVYELTIQYTKTTD